MSWSPLVAAADLRDALAPEAVLALDDMLASLAADPRVLARLFPGAARRTARGELGAGGPRIEDAVRGELVAAAAKVLEPAALGDELAGIYRHGDADERRAVLLALSALGDPRVPAEAILLDALRTNDVRLVAAAMGPCARSLAAHDWRHGVLKCLFVGAPLQQVADLRERTDGELVAMVRRYVLEREAAGRAVPEDALLVLDLMTPTTPMTGQEG